MLIKDQHSGSNFVPSDEDIVITGIAGRFPECYDINDFWQKLLDGVELSSIDDRRWPVGFLNLPERAGKIPKAEYFDHLFFDYPENEVNYMDPQVRVFHETTMEAFLDAGVDPEDVKGPRSSMFTGWCYNDHGAALNEDEEKVPPFVQAVSSRVALHFQLQGLCLGMDTACASSFSALNAAFSHLKSGQADTAIVGGFAVHLSPATAYGFCQLSMTSMDGRSKCMDAGANGYCRSEAVVSLLLQKRKVAKRIYATIINSRTNTDGFKVEGITFPSIATQKRLMEEVYDEIGLDPRRVDYVEAHMTGTAAGDPVESAAIASVLCKGRKGPLPIGCLKSNMGHSEGASGLCAISKACMVFQRKVIPANLHLKTFNPNIEPLIKGELLPITKNMPFNGDIVALNCFGFGGANVHMVIRGNEIIAGPESDQITSSVIPGLELPRLVHMSARGKESLDAHMKMLRTEPHSITRDFLSLIHDVSFIVPKRGFLARGYALMDKGKNVIHSQEVIGLKEKKPLWFVFTNLGSTVNQDLEPMQAFPSFADCLSMCESYWRSNYKGKNKLSDILFRNMSYSMGLVDLIKDLKLEPEGFVGHSIGEIICAYYDGCITRYETLDIIFLIGSVLSKNQEKGSTLVYIQGLSQEELVAKLPVTSEIVGSLSERSFMVLMDKSPRDIKIRIPTASLTIIDSHNVPLHSSKIIQSYNDISVAIDKKMKLSKIKRSRSSRWFSSSIPQEYWLDRTITSGSFFARICASRVKLSQVIDYIPKNAALIEVGPSSTLLNQLKKMVGPDAVYIPLVGGSQIEVLNSIGCIFNAGHNPDISILYPKVSYPVPATTASISPLIKWEHEKPFLICRNPDYFNYVKGVRPFTIDIQEVRDKYLMGHVVDGRNLYPATGYLYIVWETFAHYHGVTKAGGYKNLTIEFRDVNIMRASMIPKQGTVTFVIQAMKSTGQFSVSEGGTICVTGFARICIDDPGTENLNSLVQRVTPENDGTNILAGSDIYKELRVRGYDYGPTFQGLMEVDDQANYGRVKWLGNWVSFSDSFLQLAIFANKSRDLCLPTTIEYLKCNHQVLDAAIKNSEDGTIPIFYDRQSNIGCCDGIFVKGLKATKAPRRNAQHPLVERYSFTPYDQLTNTQSKETALYLDYCNEMAKNLDQTMAFDPTEDVILKKLVETHSPSILQDLVELREQKLVVDEMLDRDYTNEWFLKKSMENESMIRNAVDIVQENVTGKHVTTSELSWTSSFVSPIVASYMRQKKHSTIFHPSVEEVKDRTDGVAIKAMKEFGSSAPNAPPLKADLIIVNHPSTSLTFMPLPSSSISYSTDQLIPSLLPMMDEGTFCLMVGRSRVHQFERKIQTKMIDLVESPLVEPVSLPMLMDQFNTSGFNIISIVEDDLGFFSVLARKPVAAVEEPAIIDVSTTDYSWIEQVKGLVKERIKNPNGRVWIKATDSTASGVVGLVNCLRKEEGGGCIRCFFSTENSIVLTKEIMDNDMVMNIIVNGQIGSFRYFTSSHEPSVVPKTECFLDVQTKGDLSSLKYYECIMGDDDNRIDVHYGALNFKDVMVASGRIPLSAYPEDYAKEGNLGMEFSGIHRKTGRRVMGVVDTNSICTSVVGKDKGDENVFLWYVPPTMTLEQGATIPVVYFTVYYGLVVRARMRRGETILIHAGSGGVGQAAINVCSSYGCEIFTTVGSKEKKQFLLDTFPHLKEENILHSRDLTFEENILKLTNGVGVDIILNSLSEEKMKATMNCLAPFGRFCEIGKYDIIQNHAFDTSLFEENREYHVVCVAHLFVDEHSRDTVKVVNKLVNDGISSGEVKPIRADVFNRDETEVAFRFMAQGKHVGKVLIKMRDEDEKVVTIPSIARTSFSGNKTYIVTGALGGFGLELMHWMVQLGARHIIGTSRSGPRNAFQHISLRRLKKLGAEIVIVKEDMLTAESTDRLLRHRGNKELGGIFHLAMVLADSILENQTQETFDIVCGAKVKGTIYLDQQTRDMNLDHFVCFSSLTSGRGNAGQTNYGFANSTMERICEERRSLGLAGTAIQWGAIGDVGVVAELMGGNNVVIGGSVPQRIPSCFSVLDSILSSTDPQPVYSSIVPADNMSNITDSKEDLLKIVCHILGVKDPATLQGDQTLGDLGIDSLMAVEIRQALERDYNVVLSATEVRHLKISEIAKMKRKVGGGDEKATIDGPSDVKKRSRNPFVLQEDVFTLLTTAENHAGAPVFAFPPIEGDFIEFQHILDQIIRPVVGINWVKECDSMTSVDEIANFYKEAIMSEYPSLMTYDIMGYSFGCLLAQETIIKLEAAGRQVPKAVFLDGSPSMMKSMVTNALKEEEDILFGWLGSLNCSHMYETLFKMEEADRYKLLCKMAYEELGATVTIEQLEAAKHRSETKVDMVMKFDEDQGTQMQGEIRLYRAQVAPPGMNEDYNLKKHVKDGRVETTVFEGDHKSFLFINAKDISVEVDEFYHSQFSIA